jgi:hypothetical protein
VLGLAQDRDRVEVRLDGADGAEVGGGEGREGLPEVEGGALAGTRSATAELEGELESTFDGRRQVGVGGERPEQGALEGCGGEADGHDATVRRARRDRTGLTRGCSLLAETQPALGEMVAQDADRLRPDPVDVEQLALRGGGECREGGDAVEAQCARGDVADRPRQRVIHASSLAVETLARTRWRS